MAPVVVCLLLFAACAPPPPDGFGQFGPPVVGTSPMSGAAIGAHVRFDGYTYKARLASCGVFTNDLSITLVGLEPAQQFVASYTAASTDAVWGPYNGVWGAIDSATVTGVESLTFPPPAEPMSFAGCLFIEITTSSEGQPGMGASPFNYYVTF